MRPTDWRNGSASDSSPEGYVFESRIGHTKVAGAAARSFPKLTRPPNAGGGAALTKESVAAAKTPAEWDGVVAPSPKCAGGDGRGTQR